VNIFKLVDAENGKEMETLGDVAGAMASADTRNFAPNRCISLFALGVARL